LAVEDAVSQVVTSSSGGLSLPQNRAVFMKGQVEALRAPRLGREKLAERAEAVVLALDSGLRSLGVREAQKVAKRLGDVAEETALAARLAQEGEQGSRARARIEQSLVGLRTGARELLRLGELGADLGSVAEAGVQRIQNAFGADDLYHTELAALHLAARLHRPNPSFGSKGSQGVESGGGGSPGNEAPSGEQASDADRAFDKLAQQIAQLSEEHAGAVGRVGSALEEAARKASDSGQSEAARQAAEALRRAVNELPQPGRPPGSPEAAAALAREHAQALAHGLEQMDLEQAVESGKSAMSAFDEAKRRARGNPMLERMLENAERATREALDVAKEQLAEQKRAASEQAREALKELGKLERELAERAKNLRSEAEASEAALPEELQERLERAEELMKRAAQALSEGDGERALELQRQAQRLLDDDSDEPPEDGAENPKDSSEADGDRGVGTGGEVPDEDAQNRAEEFRQRVLRGLSGDKSIELAPAVKRYAEGLLR
jgi:hypothetical protein